MATRVVRCRLPCDLHEGGQSRRGIAVNLSTTGLFVQTGASFEPGTELGLELEASDGRPSLKCRARVVRVKKVHPSAQAVVARGMGLEVIEPGPDWEDLVIGMGCLGAEAAPPAVGDASFGLPHFRVVLRSKDGIRIRTRIVNVACVSEQEARAGVEADVEKGWEIVKVERSEVQQIKGLEARRFRVVALREGGYRRWETSFEAASAEDARQAAVSDLGPDFRIESVQLAESGTDLASESKAAPPPKETDRVFQVTARLEDGSCIRTRVSKLKAASAEDAKRRVVQDLGEGWQAVKVTPLPAGSLVAPRRDEEKRDG